MSRTYLDFTDDLQIRRAVNDLEAQRDDLLAALREMVDTAKYARIDMDSSTGDILRHDALVRARLAIAKATTGEQS